MGCNCKGQNNNIQQPAPMREELMELKRPSTLTLTELQKIYKILFIVGNARSCNEGNRYVDYVIRWLIEDGIRYEKYDIDHPYSSKFGVTKTPSIIILLPEIKIIAWRGIALSYREIINQLSLV